MYYQLPNGKTVYLTVEEFLSLTDGDVQYLISLDYGESVLNPFRGSAVDNNESEKVYDFDYLNTDDDEPIRGIISDAVCCNGRLIGLRGCLLVSMLPFES